MVKALAFEGAPQSRICLHLDIDQKTLAKHYRRELDLGVEFTCALVAESMARIATRPNGGMAAVAAGRYILGCKAQWREVSKIEVEQVGAGITGINAILRAAKEAEADELLAAIDAEADQPTIN